MGHKGAAMRSVPPFPTKNQRGSGRGVSGLGIGGFSGSSIKGLGALVSRVQLFSQKMWAEEVAADFRFTNNPKP